MLIIIALIGLDSLFSLWWFLKYFPLLLSFLELKYFSMGMCPITKEDPVKASVYASAELLVFKLYSWINKVSRSAVLWLICATVTLYRALPHFGLIYLYLWSCKLFRWGRLHLPGEEAVCSSAAEWRCLPPLLFAGQPRSLHSSLGVPAAPSLAGQQEWPGPCLWLTLPGMLAGIPSPSVSSPKLQEVRWKGDEGLKSFCRNNWELGICIFWF